MILKKKRDVTAVFAVTTSSLQQLAVVAIGREKPQGKERRTTIGYSPDIQQQSIAVRKIGLPTQITHQ